MDDLRVLNAFIHVTFAFHIRRFTVAISRAADRLACLCLVFIIEYSLIDESIPLSFIKKLFFSILSITDFYMRKVYMEKTDKTQRLFIRMKTSSTNHCIVIKLSWYTCLFYNQFGLISIIMK